MRTVAIAVASIFIWLASADPASAQQANRLRLEDIHELDLATKIPPRLSPDGKWVACLRRNDNMVFSYYLVRTDGKTELRLHDLPQNTPADLAMLFLTSGMWSADSKKILVGEVDKDVDRLVNNRGGLEHGLSLVICDVSELIEGKKTEPAITQIDRADGVPFGGVFGKDGKVYWSSVAGLGMAKTSGEIRVFDPVSKKDKKFIELPDFGVIYLTASPDRSLLGGLTMAVRTEADEEGIYTGGMERRLWVCRLADGSAAFTGPRSLARSTLVDGRKTFWSEDGKSFYAVSSATGDMGPPVGLFAFEPFQVQADATDVQLARFKTLIERLGSPEWQKREEAYNELLRNAEAAKKLLEEASQSQDTEIAERARGILKSQTGVKKVAPSQIFEAGGLIAPGIISAASPTGTAVFIDTAKDAVIQFKDAEPIFLVDRQGNMGLFVGKSGHYFSAVINISIAPDSTSRPATQQAKSASQI